MTTTVFAEALRSIAARIPEAQLLMITGTDGIPVERLALRPDSNLDAVATEYSTVLRSSLGTAEDTGLGRLTELCVVTERMTALLVSITPEYFLFAALGPEALQGRARFALRLASLQLEREFL